ncbi:MAG: PKD domain-containing protein, partial [Solirubrobacteraceae bacterium]
MASTPQLFGMGDAGSYAIMRPDLPDCVQYEPQRVKAQYARVEKERAPANTPRGRPPMLKPLTRNFSIAFALILALAAPSALAARHSYRATTRAAHHRTGHHRKVKRKHPHRGKTVKVVALHNTATISAATLIGDSAVESHVDYLNAGEAEAFRFQANASDVAGVSHIYVDSHNSARTLTVGLYSSTATGHPGSLLSVGSITTVQSSSWNVVALAPTSLVAGKSYWLALLGQRGTLRYRDRRNGPCPSETSAQTGLGSLPSSWRTGKRYADCPVSAYVTAAEPVFSPPAPVEPTLVVPADTVLPAISGTPVQGQVLSATDGTWTGSPTSFARQWQDCDKSGANCSNASGGTGANYKLTSNDTGHMMRVVVAASNEVGTSSASSAATPPVVTPPPAPAPTASFSFAPSSPVAGETVEFDGSASTCPNEPCTYEWSDDGSALQPVTPLWPLGIGQTLSFAFQEVGTKYVRLTVTDALGQVATTETNVAVAAAIPPPPPPPPPVAPTNTSLPTVSGTTTEGQVLNATNGTWTGSPSSFVYQWQDCNSSGSACVNIAGAKAVAYTLTAGDVGDTLRVVVTASNEGGSASASSAATAVVAAVPPPPPGAPANTSLPTVSGTTTEGQALSAAHGTWTGSPTSYAYQWQDCNSSGSACVNIAGAKAVAYT